MEASGGLHTDHHKPGCQHLAPLSAAAASTACCSTQREPPQGSHTTLCLGPGDPADVPLVW